MGLYDRYVLPALVNCACSTRPVMKQREKIVPLAEGRVMELGCGSGTNFGLYDWGKVERLFAVEPAPGMTARARKTAAELGRAQIDIIEATAEDAPVDAASIDTAVISFVLCTIPDWRSALAQVRRFLKPDGKILFAEHGLAPDASVVKWQRRLEPFQKRLGGGCHLTRNPAQMLSDAGFSVRRCETMYLPKTPKPLGYQYWGEAVAA